MIALDFDGVVANYGDHITRTEFNAALPALLPRPPRRVVIVTNQGGMALHAHAPEKYPSPERVADRLRAGVTWLKARGYEVDSVFVSAYHPRADPKDVLSAAQRLRARFEPAQPKLIVYTDAHSRKPSPFMLQVAGATVYYGDSPEDEQAARAAGIEFVSVPRFG